MTKNIIIGVTLWMACAISGWGNTISGTITISVDLSAQRQGEEVRLWLPYPMTDAAQDITNLTIDGNYSDSTIHTGQEFQTPMLFARWVASATNRNLTLAFTATRMEQEHPLFPSAEPAWDPADYAPYLRATGNASLSDDIQQLADQITKGTVGVLGKARAIYDWTVQNTYRDPNTRGCGSGDMETLLQRPCGKCADISSIFTSLCRASGVPAREVLGIRMGKKPIQDITKWQHCWAEFFLPGSGWISVDPADVRKKMLVDNLQLDDPATAACREYFFGGLDAYRVKLGQGRNIHLSPEAMGGPINYLMYPFAQVGGQTIDWLNPEQFTYTITFTAKPDNNRKLAEK